MSFEWDNREVQRYNLIQSFTPAIFWHYVSNQYFPLNFFETAQNFEEHFDDNIRAKLCQREISNKDLMSLYNLDMFKDRMVMSKEKFMTEQLLESSVLPVINENSNTPSKDTSTQLEDVKPKNDPNNVDCMINFLERYVTKVHEKNDVFVKDLSDKLEVTYNPTSRRELETEMWEEYAKTEKYHEKMKFWNLNDMFDFNNSIYFDVAAAFLEDCQQNLKDYLADPKNLLVDTQYSTKLEEQYLLYVAQKHQEKNESHSKKLQERIHDVQEIFEKDLQADRNAIIQSHPVTVSLLNERRQKEEDAK
jgi:hypothetical protein